MKVEIKILNKEFYRVDKLGGSYYNTPQYQTDGSAAMDLICTEDVTIYPGEVRQIKTGLAIHIASISSYTINGFEYHTPPGDKDGYFTEGLGVAGVILPRSGLGTKGLVLANTVGLIDGDYQGELIVQAWNRLENNEFSKFSMSHRGVTDKQISLKAGDRFAQLAFVPIIKVQWKEVEEFSIKTTRYDGGFGSSGR